MFGTDFGRTNEAVMDGLGTATSAKKGHLFILVQDLHRYQAKTISPRRVRMNMVFTV